MMQHDDELTFTICQQQHSVNAVVYTLNTVSHSLRSGIKELNELPLQQDVELELFPVLYLSIIQNNQNR